MTNLPSKEWLLLLVLANARLLLASLHRPRTIVVFATGSLLIYSMSVSPGQSPGPSLEVTAYAFWGLVHISP